MSHNNMPKNWEPPYPSWSAQFSPETSTVVVGYVGAQYLEGNIDDFREWMRLVLSIDDAPSHTGFRPQRF